MIPGADPAWGRVGAAAPGKFWEPMVPPNALASPGHHGRRGELPAVGFWACYREEDRKRFEQEDEKRRERLVKEMGQ